MTDEPVNDHPSLINAEAILADFARCTPPLEDLLPPLADPANWYDVAGTAYFKPPPDVDPAHVVYLLLPLHLFNPLPDAKTP